MPTILRPRENGKFGKRKTGNLAKRKQEIGGNQSGKFWRKFRGMVYRKIIGEVESEMCVVGCIYHGAGKRSAPVSKYPTHHHAKTDRRAIETPGKPLNKNASDY
jgi:hypothetical protein